MRSTRSRSVPMPAMDPVDTKDSEIATRAERRAVSPAGRRLQPDEMLPVVLELVDRFLDIGQRLVLAGLDEAAIDLGFPAQGKFLERADVQVARSEEHTSELQSRE